MNDTAASILEIVDKMSRRYQISAIRPYLESCRAFAEETTLNVAVLGRFKTGKSSFLNYLIGRSILPVGVVPVTAVVTEVQYGPEDRAEVHYLDGHCDIVPMNRIGEFVSENENSENVKHVSRVLLTSQSMKRYPGIRFVDTPGLHSIFEHNTTTSLDWLPNVGLALVAVAADLPISHDDIEFIRNLSKYTPNISLLLTKIDLLNSEQLSEVTEFVKTQLDRHSLPRIPLLQYSIRPGYESFRSHLDEHLLSQTHQGAGDQKFEILQHKLRSLLGECIDYLTLGLKAAEVEADERTHLRIQILGQKESLDETRLALRLIVRHEVGELRLKFEKMLQNDEIGLRRRLIAELEQCYPTWTRKLSVVTERFELWIRDRMEAEIAKLSEIHRNEFAEPLHSVSRQLTQSVQDFRSRVSERTLSTLGIPLRTTGIDFSPQKSRFPDVRVGKIFDHHWELLSIVIPMRLVGRLVKSHFETKIEDLVFMNLSRLAAQWEEIITAGLRDIEEESIRRLGVFIDTVEALMSSTTSSAVLILSDIEKLENERIPILKLVRGR